MPKFSKSIFTKYDCAAWTAILIILAGCASIQQPTGGPKDVTPPKVVRETPANLTKRFSAKKIEIEFDEYFKLSNEAKEISVSPAMDRAPNFKVKKKILEITFQDTLEKNTTYTINFGKGLVDYNEGNILKNYSYVFATGDVIDSLSIAGTVISAITGKPEMETTVFIIPTRQDSIFGKKRANLFTTTDSSGNFKLKNLKADTYRLYAVKEDGGDRIYNSTNESIAFIKDSINLTRDTSKFLLQTFKEVPYNFRVVDRKLFGDGHFQFTYNMPLANPGLKILTPPELDAKKYVEYNATGDTATMWLPEITFDSINVVPMQKDTRLDTVTIRRNKKDTYNTAVNITDNAALTGKIRQRSDLILTLSSPITSFDQNKIYLLEDSIPKKFTFKKDSTSARKFRLSYTWRNKKSYIIKASEGAFTSITGGKSKAYDKDFEMDPDENYSMITLNITPTDANTSYIAILIQDEKMIRSSAFTGNKQLNWGGVAPGKYSIRFVYDANKNGSWDTGNVRKRIQPEKIWNYDNEIPVRVNLDIEEKITLPAE